MAAHSSIFVRKIPWTEEPGRLQYIGSQWVRRDWATEHTHTPSVDEWINKVWYMHTMEYYSPLKRKEILSHDITWMNFEIRQPQKDKQIWYDSIHMKYLKWSNS